MLHTSWCQHLANAMALMMPFDFDTVPTSSTSLARESESEADIYGVSARFLQPPPLSHAGASRGGFMAFWRCYRLYILCTLHCIGIRNHLGYVDQPRWQRHVNDDHFGSEGTMMMMKAWGQQRVGQRALIWCHIDNHVDGASRCQASVSRWSGCRQSMVSFLFLIRHSFNEDIWVLEIPESPVPPVPPVPSVLK